MKLGNKSNHKMTETSLNSSELNMKLVLENALEAVLVINADGILVYTNRKAYEITGYKPQELSGKSYKSLNFFPGEYLTQIDELLLLGITGRSTGPNEFELKRKDGKKVWIEIYINPIQQDGNSLITVFFHNITGHKQAEEELKEGKEFSSKLLDNAPNPVMVINPDFSIKYINMAFEKLTGFSAADITGIKPPYPWWPEENREEIGASIRETIARGGRKRESIFQKRNGELFCIEAQSAVILRDGVMKYFMVGWTDITERIRAEEALRGSEEKFRNLFVHAKDAVILTDTHTGIIIEVNPTGCRLLGLPKDKIVGMHQWEMHPPEMVEKYKQVFREHVEKGIVANDDMIIQRANGSQVQVELSTSVIKMGDRKIIQGVFRNVTERKQMEKALRESEEKFSAAFRASPNSITITTLKDGVFLDVNDSFIRDNGYTREEVIGHSSKELKIWAKPEERDRILHALRECGQVVNEEYSSRTKYGEIRTMLLSAEPINIAGEPCIIGVTTDITELKRMGNELRIHRDKLEELVNERTNELTEANERLQHELEERKKVEQELRKTKNDAEIIFRTKN